MMAGPSRIARVAPCLLVHMSVLHVVLPALDYVIHLVDALELRTPFPVRASAACAPTSHASPPPTPDPDEQCQTLFESISMAVYFTLTVLLQEVMSDSAPLAYPEKTSGVAPTLLGN